MKWFAIVGGLALLVLGPLGMGSAANQPLVGDLDPSFGNSGIVSLGGSGVGGIAVQPDGKIVVASNSTSGGVLARYLPDGSIDPSFGDGGSVQTQVGAGTFTAGPEVALQSDGKIVVAGTSFVQGDENNSSVFILARYNPDGSVDTSFGTDGTTKTAIPEQGQPVAGTLAGVRSLAILGGGEIVAAGGANWDDGAGRPSNFVLVKYTSSGSLDPTFGEGGIVQTQFYGDDSLEGIVVEPDGKVVATGSGGLGGHGQDIATMALARYEADGSLDPTFGTGGEVTTEPHLRYEGGPSVLLGRKIVVAGDTEYNAFLVVARFRASGRLDSTFGKHGFVEIKRATTGFPTAVLAQNDGKILIAASGGGLLVRLLPNGRLDPSFGTRGIVSLGASALALQTDEKVLVGTGVDRVDDTPALARLIGGNNCVVPALRGKTVPKANAALTKSYCAPGAVSKVYSSKIARRRVVSTAPRLGDRLPSGSKVDLVVSKGKRP